MVDERLRGGFQMMHYDELSGSGLWCDLVCSDRCIRYFWCWNHCCVEMTLSSK
jgi:hypothetical protein